MKDSPAGLLLAACLLCAVVAMIALVRAADWTRDHWVLVAFLAAGLVLVPIYLWHRRQMVYYREQWHTGEGWEKMPGFARRDMWACPYCRALVGGLDHAEEHMDPNWSACAAYLKHLEEQDQAPAQQPVEVDVLNTPGRGWPAVLPDQDEE